MILGASVAKIKFNQKAFSPLPQDEVANVQERLRSAHPLLHNRLPARSYIPSEVKNKKAAPHSTKRFVPKKIFGQNTLIHK